LLEHIIIEAIVTDVIIDPLAIEGCGGCVDDRRAFAKSPHIEKSEVGLRGQKSSQILAVSDLLTARILRDAPDIKVVCRGPG
jgi:hypothetical protein